MRLKLPVIFILVALILGFLPSASLAQTDPLQKAQNDYSFQYSKYVDADKSFTDSLAAYESFKTVAQKDDALKKGKAKLKQADNLYISYLLLLKELGNSFDWRNQNNQKAQIYQNIDSEIAYFQSSQKQIDSVQTLEQMPQVSKDLEAHIDTQTSIFAAKTKAGFEIVQIQAALNYFQITAGDIRVYASQKLPTDTSGSFLQNWDTEVAKVSQNTQSQIDLAISQTNSRDFNDNQFSLIARFTDTAKSILLSAIPLFNQAANIK